MQCISREFADDLYKAALEHAPRPAGGGGEQHHPGTGCFSASTDDLLYVRVGLKVDSTDASHSPKLSTEGGIVGWTLLTLTVDSADATPTYPEDSTDEAITRIKYSTISSRQ